MAKTRKKAATTETEAVKPSETRPAISQKKLRSLLATARSAQADIDEIAGGLGNEIKIAVEKHYLHRKAFNFTKMADRMEPEKLADLLDCLDHYLDISGLRDRAASAQRLPMEGAPEEDDDDNVRRFPQPEGVAAE